MAGSLRNAAVVGLRSTLWGGGSRLLLEDPKFITPLELQNTLYTAVIQNTFV